MGLRPNPRQRIAPGQRLGALDVGSLAWTEDRRRGWNAPHPTHPMPAPLGERLRTVVSMALFLVLTGYVGFSAIRLGLLLWQRFAPA